MHTSYCLTITHHITQARRVFEETKMNLHVNVRKYVSKVLDGTAQEDDG